MEHPAQEIRDVIQTLCTGPPAEQQAAIRRYYLPDAEFVHPLCRVPGFGSGSGKESVRQHAPGRLVDLVERHGGAQAADRVNSRRLIAAIFRWYKILSPQIALGIESVAWDAAQHRLYVAMHQRFALWFVPLYAAHVRLVVELHLAAVVDGQGHDGNSYAAVAAQHAQAAQRGQQAQGQQGHEPNTARNRQVNGVPGTDAAHQPPRTRYYIARQEDHYQVNEVFKFFTLSAGAWLWALVQLFATVLCLGGATAWDTTIGVVLGTKRTVEGSKK
ncbi:uncharacterized protein SPSK_09665 [Sporothrix schenckii 1099-18]|uniref:SigF-like NTF2-like domain-containing protein n=2 Tax=Sporothrix schenckii TaxID=29908 RepID=U7Q8C2_SPOS1|nr:uncharacterized protein SPSK_09665 [Sporothrix schenckii 1099-18]ERT03315.1 hypothetical protein HMPREF1624_01626 [Sporothrix schenckii ATCC 58251]KJR84250.1 hypothetical protein SPSK_09665 [Sporothrix schenckii 1099-18]